MEIVRVRKLVVRNVGVGLNVGIEEDEAEGRLRCSNYGYY